MTYTDDDRAREVVRIRAAEVNVPLLRKAVEWAEAEAAKPPELCEWNQQDLRVRPDQFSEWDLDYKASECGTCFCIAGYIIQISDPSLWGSLEGGYCADAARLLGVEDVQGLFQGHNTIEDVRRIAEDLAGERL